MTHLTRILTKSFISLTIIMLSGAITTTAGAQEGSQQDLQHDLQKTALDLSGWRHDMVQVDAGEVELLFPIEGEEAARVEAFFLDSTPVTNQQYLEFVLDNPEWSRSLVPEVFAQAGYLTSWASDADYGANLPNAPVTGVSWFGAAAFCEARGARLPTEAEWEYVARAGYQQRDGYNEAGYRERVLQLTTSRPSQPLPVHSGEPNAFGVYDLHGQVWEWVFDIGSGFNTSDSRSEGDRRLQLVCGGGSSGAADKNDYAAFLRYAFRSGLSGDYAGAGLGFRCAA